MVHFIALSIVCRTTIDSPNPNKQCALPFQYNGANFTKCTASSYSAKKFWCPTDDIINDVGGMNAWGWCDENCETELPGGCWDKYFATNKTYFVIVVHII